jgi:anti-anti-sigma factor
MSQLTTGSSLVPSARLEGTTLVAAVTGEIDLNNSPEMRNALLELVGRHGVRKLVLNLSRVPYMDSSAIAVLVELLRKLGKGGTVALTDLQPRVKGLLEIARLDTIFSIARTEQDALASK